MREVSAVEIPQAHLPGISPYDRVSLAALQMKFSTLLNNSGPVSITCVLDYSYSRRNTWTLCSFMQAQLRSCKSFPLQTTTKKALHDSRHGAKCAGLPT